LGILNWFAVPPLQGVSESLAFWRKENPSAVEMVEAHFRKHEGEMLEQIFQACA
jgi:hypothetical protein